MAQKIKQGNIFGRIGSGIGKGLAEQVPKEIERARLSSGLEKFEQEHQNLTPIQQLSRLSAIPGITPQMIQSFSELAKQQNQRNAYGRRGIQGDIQNPQSSPNISDVQFANLPQGGVANAGQSQQPIVDQRTPNVAPTEFNQPQIVNENPLNEKNLTRPPWTPDQRDARINQYLNQGFLAPQAETLAADDEARDLSAPKAYQQRYEELTGRQKDARDALTRHLETKLQKKGEELFKDITGEMRINLERGMDRDLRLNPNATIEDVANDWSNRGLNLAKAKNKYEKLAATTGLENIFKGKETLNKLKEYSDIFKRAGDSEEYYNLLQESDIPPIKDERGNIVRQGKKGLGLSPQGAASIAFPLNKQSSEFISRYKPSTINDFAKRDSNARKAALEIEKYLDTDQSLLSVVRAFRDKDPYFDQKAFFEQLSEDKDLLRLNERQRLEISEGTSSILPTWGDILILPTFRGL